MAVSHVVKKCWVTMTERDAVVALMLEIIYLFLSHVRKQRSHTLESSSPPTHVRKLHQLTYSHFHSAHLGKVYQQTGLLIYRLTKRVTHSIVVQYVTKLSLYVVSSQLIRKGGAL